MSLRAIMSVFRFESRRTFTVGRLLFAAGMASLPVALATLIQFHEGHLEHGGRAAIALYVLGPGLLCVMGLLLWATPTIHAELEGGTWPYLAVRPVGKGAILLGKYVNAVLWTACTVWLSVAISLAVIRPEEAFLRTWWALAALVGLSCLSNGALFVLLGALFLRRAMVVAVAYTFLVEVLTAFIPAMIHQITVQYHLRNMLVKWLPGTIRFHSSDFNAVFAADEAPAWQHALVLLGFTAAWLAAAIWVVRSRELVKSDES